MKLPFSVEQFFEVFGRYNQAVWPAQIVLVVLGVVAFGLVFSKRTGAARLLSAILALLWAWMAIAYHLVFFAAINPVARVFGLIFLVQAWLFSAAGVVRPRLVFGPVSTVRTVVGSALVLYALVFYPLLGYLAGHRYPETPTFGVPCPTTILTLGLLLFARSPFPRYLYFIPLLWSGVGSFAAFNLGVPQDLGLLAAGVLGGVAWALPQRVSPSPA